VVEGTVPQNENEEGEESHVLLLYVSETRPMPFGPYGPAICVPVHFLGVEARGRRSTADVTVWVP
jgi:hypothetical protein